ncbi:MAG: GNAT family N-acetyltransferase [Anaerolineae bacterium]|nr:GNAT family N-acetyltransferase [Anaerolineae bacterium]
MEYRTDLPSTELVWALFQTTGWYASVPVTPEELILAVSNSWFWIAVYDAERLVGFGRIVTDGVLHAMIYDLIVHPDYQMRGIGSQILERLVGQCLSIGIRDIQLFCAHGKRAFYEKRGFVARPDDSPGMQYQRE